MKDTVRLALVLLIAQRIPDVIEIALAVFDGSVPVTPDAHIFVESGANWTKIPDGLPQHSEGRSSPTKIPR